MPDGDSVLFSIIVGKLRQVLLQFRVQRCLKRGVEEHEDITSRRIGGRYLGGTPGNVGKTNQVRIELWIDVIDRVVDGRVQNCKIAS